MIEAIQFISYAFTALHYNSWKFNLNSFKLTASILGVFRLSTLMIYLSYPLCIILLLFGIISFISWYYFNRFGAIQYEMFSLINGVILVSQILVRILIDLNIVRIRFN